MAVRIPTAADLPTYDPRPATRLPQIPDADPVAAAQVKFGQGVSAVGGALVDIQDDQQRKTDKLNEAIATVDLFNRIVPLHAAIAKETDPDKVEKLKAEYNNVISTSSSAITDPYKRQIWGAAHAKTILQAHADADGRVTDLRRGRARAGALEQADLAIKNGASADSQEAFSGAALAIDNVFKALEADGSMTPEQAYKARSQAAEKLVIGRADWLSASGRHSDAADFIQKHATKIDPDRLRTYTDYLKPRITKEGGQRLLDSTAPGASGAPLADGAVAARIAQEARRHPNIDLELPIVTASIESNFGKASDRPGSQYQGVFQMGRAERSQMGGGDVQHGVAFLAKRKQELAEKLGREPANWEVYLAHQQGVGGATQLLLNPDKPAGRVITEAGGRPENISANGGDPSAPASAFVGLWRTKYQRAASRVGGIAVSDGTSQDQPVAIGDSIAAHLIRKAGVGGKEYNFDRKNDSTAVAGFGPTDVLGIIASTPEGNIKGKDIFLSTGASNNPDQLSDVGDQIKTLKARGARSVTVLGVGNSKKVEGVNDKLAQIATENGVPFAGPMRKVAGDGIHSSDPKDLLAQARAARSDKAAASASGAPIPLDGAPAQPGSPDYWRAWNDRIEAAPVSQEVKDYAKAQLRQKHSEFSLGQAEAAYETGLKVMRGEIDGPGIDALVKTGTISPEKGLGYQRALAELEEKKRLRQDAIDRVSATASGGPPLDPKSKEHRKAVDLHFEEVSRSWPTIAAAQAAAAGEGPEGVANRVLEREINYAAQIGVVPERLQAKVRGNLHSGRPELAIQATDMLSRLRNSNPQLINEFAEEDLRLANSIRAYQESGMPAEQAYQRATESMKVSKAEKEARAEEWKTVRGKTEEDRRRSDERFITSKQNSIFMDDPNNVPSVMRREFEDIAKSEFERTGNLDASRQMALDTINRVWGRTGVGADGLRYERLAPEKFYGIPTMTQEQNSAWMNEQLVADVSRGAFVDPKFPITTNRILIRPALKSAPDGRPVYHLMLQDAAGIFHNVTVAGPDGKEKLREWVPDWSRSAEAQRQREGRTLTLDQLRQQRIQPNVLGTPAGRLMEDVR